jgi:hypothetical protein
MLLIFWVNYTDRQPTIRSYWFYFMLNFVLDNLLLFILIMLWQVSQVGGKVSQGEQCNLSLSYGWLCTYYVRRLPEWLPYILYEKHLLFLKIKTTVVHAFKWNCICHLLQMRSSLSRFLLSIWMVELSQWFELHLHFLSDQSLGWLVEVSNRSSLKLKVSTLMLRKNDPCYKGCLPVIDQDHVPICICTRDAWTVDLDFFPVFWLP